MERRASTAEEHGKRAAIGDGDVGFAIAIEIGCGNREWDRAVEAAGMSCRTEKYRYRCRARWRSSLALIPEIATARSGLPSPSKSPTAMESGVPLVGVL